MRKIPTLFKRVFDGNKIVDITPEVPRWLEWVLRGDGYPTVKMDGACCAIIDGKFYKRHDVKNGKVPPGAIPCCKRDPLTGHWPHWVLVDENNPGDRWFIEAKKNTKYPLIDGTYEAVGFHFQGNPYKMSYDMLEPHGLRIIKGLDRSFEGIRSYLEANEIEGIVFWRDDKPMCKIKRSDFGIPWNKRERKRK